jgi:ATP-binding cassette, subfamily B, bacterial
VVTMHGYWRFLRVAMRASSLLCVAWAASILVAAAAPLGAVVAVGAVVGAVPRVAEAGLGSPAGTTAMWWAVAAGGLFLLQWAAGALQEAAVISLGDRVDAVLARDLMDASLAADGVGHLEDPDTIDLIVVGRETFRSAYSRPGRLARTLARLATGRVVAIGCCFVVARFQPLLGAALLVAGFWAAAEDKWASRTEAAHHHGGTELARRTGYYYELGVTPPAAKEVRVFGLSGFLLDRFTASWRRSMVDVFAPTGRRPLVAGLVLATVVAFGTAWIAREAVAGRVGLGAAAVYAQALMVSVGAMQSASWAGLQTELALATLRRFDQAVAAVAAVGEPPRPARVDSPRSQIGPAVATQPHDQPAGEGLRLPGEEIRFEGVSFAYPGGRTDALHDLNLVIPAGRSLAIVGANGAGKSTIVKLLCRAYEPTGGRLTVDGIDLTHIDATAWRRRLAGVLQDPTRFDLSAAANVGFGRVDLADDRTGIEAAAAAAGVADRVAALPRGWETPLSPAYDSGVDLSGGEWQKIGLARALFAVRHGASVLILDEPAAHLDARAEARLHAHFLALTEGLTTIVISHRFSTVRQAASIAVLDRGRVVEQGSHEELMARGGAYAEMFRLQADRFAATGAVSDR